MPRNNLSQNILHPAASTDSPVSSTAGHSVPDNSVTAGNLSGESNAARQQQQQQGPFRLQAEIIETGTPISERYCSVSSVAISSEIFGLQPVSHSSFLRCFNWCSFREESLLSCSEELDWIMYRVA